MLMPVFQLGVPAGCGAMSSAVGPSDAAVAAAAAALLCVWVCGEEVDGSPHRAEQHTHKHGEVWPHVTKF